MDQLSVDDLYRRWHKPVRSWVRRCNVPKLWIEDVTQEVFLRLVKYKPTVSDNIVGYIFRVASNVSHEWMARSCFSKTHVEFDDLGEGVIGVADSPEISLEEQEFQTALEIGISKLQGRRLLVIMLRMYEEKTYKEIADELGLTYRTVLRDIVFAHQQLRIELKPLMVEESIDERHSDSFLGRLQGATGEELAGARDSALDVEPIDRVHSPGPPCGGLHDRAA